MSTKKKVVVTTTPRTAPTAAKTKSSTVAPPKSNVLIFGKTNYLLVLAGIGLVALGLVMMSGGAMPDPNTWDESLIYSSRRTLLGPVLILLGLVVEIVAIFRNPGVETSAEEMV